MPEFKRLFVAYSRRLMSLFVDLLVQTLTTERLWCVQERLKMNPKDTSTDILADLDATEVARRLRRLTELERLIEERSDELAWVNERLVSELYERAEVEAEASSLARYDSVTGLPNRVSFEARLDSLLTVQAGSGEPAAVMLIGLDKLDQIRETMGYQVCDDVARVIADRLRLAVRGSDVIARIGDDTFALLLTRLRASEDAAAVARKLHQVLDEPLDVVGKTVRLAPTMGLSLYPADGVEADVLLSHADSAMRHASTQLGGLFQFYHPQIREQMSRNLLLEAQLRTAVETHQFVNHYQPRFNLKTGACVGVEALVRWAHPEHGLMYPAEFLDVAIATGLIVPMGAQVLAQACRDAAHWGGRGLVAVNVSTREFLGASVIDTVRAALESSGLPASRLQIEITEASLGPAAGIGGEGVSNQALPDVTEALKGLREMGVRVALDDFGAGAASLSALHAYEVDALKIDTQFVHRLPDDTRAAALVASIVHIAKRFRLGIVAEGIETEEQRNYLSKIGCTEGQGYGLGRPQSAQTVGPIAAAAKSKAVRAVKASVKKRKAA